MKREYVWISTKAVGDTATVMAHHKTQENAKQFADACGDGAGYEGTVPKAQYPIGKEWSLIEELN
jgi:hypothetical protein